MECMFGYIIKTHMYGVYLRYSTINPGVVVRYCLFMRRQKRSEKGFIWALGVMTGTGGSVVAKLFHFEFWCF